MAVPFSLAPVMRVKTSKTVLFVAISVGDVVKKVFEYNPDIPLISTPPFPETDGEKVMSRFGARINFEPFPIFTLSVLLIFPVEACETEPPLPTCKFPPFMFVDPE